MSEVGFESSTGLKFSNLWNIQSLDIFMRHCFLRPNGAAKWGCTRFVFGRVFCYKVLQKQVSFCKTTDLIEWSTFYRLYV